MRLSHYRILRIVLSRYELAFRLNLLTEREPKDRDQSCDKPLSTVTAINRRHVFLTNWTGAVV